MLKPKRINLKPNKTKAEIEQPKAHKHSTLKIRLKN